MTLKGRRTRLRKYGINAPYHARIAELEKALKASELENKGNDND